MQRTNSKRRSRKGFTLMEVLLVMAILIGLASVVTVSYINIKKSSDKKNAQLQVDALKTAVELYYGAVNDYPSKLSDVSQPPSDQTLLEKWKDGGGPFFEEEIPTDPWGQEYQYETDGVDTFRVWSMGPDKQNGSDDDITS